MKIKLANGELFNMPDWQDCTWRRDPCGRDKCVICGRINRQRAAHIAAGRDPDSPEAFAMDIKQNFAEAIKLIREAAKRDNVDLKEEEFSQAAASRDFKKHPLTVEIEKWMYQVHEMFTVPVGEIAGWWDTEAAHDVLYYTRTLCVKAQRQCDSLVELKAGDEYTDVDYLYNKYVLEFVLDKLKKGFNAVMDMVFIDKRVEVMLLAAKLQDIEDKVKKVNGFYGRKRVGVVGGTSLGNANKRFL